MRLVRAVACTLLIVQSACRTDGSTAPVNADFTLRSGQQLDVAESGVRIRLLGVPEDSRCATDVVCVWSGNAVVDLEVRTGAELDTLSLNTDVGAREGVVGGYLIRLVSLAPSTQSGRQIDQSSYRVTLHVSPIDVVCTREARPALNVILTDGTNASTTTLTNVKVVAQSGSFSDSMQVAEYDVRNGYGIGLAHERAGTYTVTVRADGYAPWSRSGIEVRRDACHVITVPVAAQLVR